MNASPRPPSDLFRAYAGKQHFEDLLSATSLPSSRFLSEYIPVAERLALCVQELPLSPEAFGSRGGALICGLHAGLLAVRSCDATIFEPKATAQERQKNDPLFRWAAYCATLANVYLLCAGQVHVEVEGQTFSFACPTLLGAQGKNYYAHWQEGRARLNECGFAYLQSFFYPGQFAHLDTSMLAMIGSAINPALATSHSETPLARVVRTSLVRIIEAEKERGKTKINPAPATPPAASPDTNFSSAPAAAPTATPSTGTAAQTVASADNPAAHTPAPAQTLDGGIAQEADPIAAGTPDVSTTAVPVLPPKLAGWIAALARAQGMETEIHVEDQKIRLSRKALNFGGPARENYTILYEGGVVEEKGSDFVICNKLARDAYVAVRSALGSEATG